MVIPQKRMRTFEAAVNTIIGSESLFIFSPQRCDILYNARHNYNDEIGNLWLLNAGLKKGNGNRTPFFNTRGKKDTLEGFFVRLIYLSSNRKWFNHYVGRLRQQLMMNPTHKIARALIECQRYIKNDGIHQMFDVPLNQPEIHAPIPRLSDHISREFMDEYPLN